MPKQYLKNFDGLRFIAAATVACSHLELVKSYASPVFLRTRFTQNAPQISVTFFFVLSGFLIMWWFLEETGGNVRNINLKKFYTNRISRTWPLYFLLVIVSMFISLLNGSFSDSATTWKKFALYFLFLPNTANEIYGADVFLGATWSLAVEEFFYLFFPLILIQIPQKKLLRTLQLIILGTLIFSILFNPLFIQLLKTDKGSTSGIIYYLSIVADRYRFYSFFLGALGAYLVFTQNRLSHILLFNHTKLTIQAFGLTLIVLFICGITFSFATQQIYSVLFALFLYIITISRYSSKFLNNRLLKTGGKISYGIYMLHMLIVMRLVNQLNFLIPVQSKFLNIIVSWSLLIGLTYALSYISFRFFEMPVLDRMRHRINGLQARNES